MFFNGNWGSEIGKVVKWALLLVPYRNHKNWVGHLIQNKEIISDFGNRSFSEMSTAAWLESVKNAVYNEGEVSI